MKITPSGAVGKIGGHGVVEGQADVRRVLSVPNERHHA